VNKFEFANSQNEFGQNQLVLGFNALDAKKYEEAREIFTKVLKTHGKLVDAYAGLARAEAALGSLDLAEAHLKESLKIKSTENVYFLLSRIYFRKNLVNEERAHLKSALELNPSNINCLFNLGLTYQNEDPHRAEDILRQVIKLKPNLSNAYLELGLVLGRLGKFIASEESLKRSIVLDDQSAWPHIYRAANFLEQKQPDAAEKEYLKACRKQPNDAYIYDFIGSFYDNIECYDKAEHYYKIGLKLDPEDRNIKRGYVTALAFQGKFNELEDLPEEFQNLDEG
jgi:protein O-GlcNAc transferase